MVESFVLSFLLALIVIKLPYFWTTNSEDLTGVQKFHFNLVPRIGGIPVFFGFFTAVWLYDLDINMVHLAIAALPVFIFGLLEDGSASIPPTLRMAATIVSVFLLFYLLDLGVQSLGFELIDYYFSRYEIVSLLFTLLIVSGFINAINIIDGYNGLMPGYSIIVLLAIAYISHMEGDSLVFQLSLILASSVLGFFILNFPFGKIFMGDGGAYFVGFMMAALGMMLVVRNQGLSYWLLLLLFIYPLYETVFSIYRKKIVRKTSPSQPDGYHLHMLIYKRLIRCKALKNNKIMCNSATSPFLWVLSLFGVIPAIVWHDNQTVLIIWVFVFMVIYTIIYRRIVHFKFKFRK